MNKLHCYSLFSQHSCFPLSVSFHQHYSFSASTPVFPCQYHSTNTTVSLPALLFSPVNIIPPTLQFLSHHSCFPLSISFHQHYSFSPSTPVFPCQYHSTNTTVSLPALLFSPVSIIPPTLQFLSFHQYFILICILILLLSEGRSGETRETSNKIISFVCPVNGQNGMLYFPILQTVQKPTSSFHLNILSPLKTFCPLYGE